MTRSTSEGRLKAIAVREKRLKLQRDELKAEQQREAEARQAASPLLDAYEEAAIRATQARQLPPGWAMARLAQLAKVALVAGDIDAQRMLALDLHKLSAELARPLGDEETETLVRGVVAAGPEAVREAMRRVGIREHGDG